MSRCPHCGAEVDSNETVCPRCDAELSNPPLAAATEPIVILEAKSAAEAQVAEATLRAEGIEAFVQPFASVSPNIGVTGDDVPELEVLVAAKDAALAREILNAPAISDEELTEAEERTW